MGLSINVMSPALAAAVCVVFFTGTLSLHIFVSLNLGFVTAV